MNIRNRKTTGICFLISGFSILIFSEISKIAEAVILSFVCLVAGGIILLEEYGIIKSSLIDSMGIK